MERMPQTPVLDHEEPVDGRTMRRTRNRSAVITALLAMIREGDLHPGAAEIAERAGVSHRSIFRYFDDLDDLVRTAIDQAFQDAAPLSAVPEVGHGSLAERVEGFVDARLELLAFVDGTMQLARTRAHSIPSIDEQIAVIAEQFRVQIGELFATELGAVEHPARGFLVDAVLVLTSYDSYTIHLRLLGSSVERIRAAWITGLTALLEN
jgi:AcrR family transcriptional regulator